MDLELQKMAILRDGQIPNEDLRKSEIANGICRKLLLSNLLERPAEIISQRVYPACAVCRFDIFFLFLFVTLIEVSGVAK